MFGLNWLDLSLGDDPALRGVRWPLLQSRSHSGPACSATEGTFLLLQRPPRRGGQRRATDAEVLRGGLLGARLLPDERKGDQQSSPTTSSHAHALLRGGMFSRSPPKNQGCPSHGRGAVVLQDFHSQEQVSKLSYFFLSAKCLRSSRVITRRAGAVGWGDAGERAARGQTARLHLQRRALHSH